MRLEVNKHLNEKLETLASVTLERRCISDAFRFRHVESGPEAWLTLCLRENRFISEGSQDKLFSTVYCAVTLLCVTCKPH